MSGFVSGLVSAACHIRGGGFKNVLVIGADVLSRYVDWTDRGSCILFRDAAGVVLVQARIEEKLSSGGKNINMDGEFFGQAPSQACPLLVGRKCNIKKKKGSGECSISTSEKSISVEVLEQIKVVVREEIRDEVKEEMYGQLKNEFREETENAM